MHTDDTEAGWINYILIFIYFYIYMIITKCPHNSYDWTQKIEREHASEK